RARGGLRLAARAARWAAPDRLPRHGPDCPGLSAQRREPFPRTRVQRLWRLLRTALERALPGGDSRPAGPHAAAPPGGPRPLPSRYRAGAPSLTVSNRARAAIP